jgi:hypothetical protein
MPLLQLGQALFQACDTRLEFCFFDDALGKTVDEPTNPAAALRAAGFAAIGTVRLSGR